MARVAVLANRAEFSSAEDGSREVIGAPIEAALLRNIEALEGHSGTFRSLHPKVCEIPFSPIIKFHLSIHECQDYQTNGYLLAMVGEPETVLNRCATALVNGRERNIDGDYVRAFRYACAELGGLGERLVALCDWRLPPQKFPPGFQFNAENINFPLSGFRLIGIMSLMDPPRANVPDSIAKCQAAGIKIIMMTGDHPSTAKAIAKSVGILSLDQVNAFKTPLKRTILN
jgi:sodium/potassium-transporting ATPase subunit alpha